MGPKDKIYCGQYTPLFKSRNTPAVKKTLPKTCTNLDTLKKVKRTAIMHSPDIMADNPDDGTRMERKYKIKITINKEFNIMEPPY